MWKFIPKIYKITNRKKNMKEKTHLIPHEKKSNPIKYHFSAKIQFSCIKIMNMIWKCKNMLSKLPNRYQLKPNTHTMEIEMATHSNPYLIWQYLHTNEESREEEKNCYRKNIL